MEELRCMFSVPQCRGCPGTGCPKLSSSRWLLAMLVWFWFFFLFFFFLELEKIVKAGTSYGIVGATKGKGEKETGLIVLWLSGLCHLLVFPTHLLGSCGSTGTER